MSDKWHSEKTQGKTLRDIEPILDADDFWTNFACNASADSLAAALQLAHAAKHGGQPKVADSIFPMRVRGVIRGKLICPNLVLSSNLGWAFPWNNKPLSPSPFFFKMIS